MSDDTELPYDPTDTTSIIEYAQVLIGSTLREHIEVDSIDDPKYRKGAFGNAIEYYYFKYPLNNDSNPDFEHVGIELKTTPLKRTKKGNLVSKERLVISNINYLEVVKETFESSHFLKKASNILLISYLHEEGKDPLDYTIEIAALWSLPPEDIPIIEKDWNTIIDKILSGRAHEISGRDTLYLEACTKAANASVTRPQPFSETPAKPRAWALKSSYMSSVSKSLLEKMEPIKRNSHEKTLDLLEVVRNRFKPYFGKTETELAEKFGYLKSNSRKPKNLCALITKKILGVRRDSKIAEFEKAGIQPKTLRIKRNGVPREPVSFPAFDYCTLVDTDFENSNFKERLESKFLFVIYQEDHSGQFRLKDVMFWQMNDEDLEEAKRCYEEMQRRVRSGHADKSVTSRENRCCHVRPHGRNKEDTCMTPYGIPVTKKAFWINAKYLAQQLKEKEL